MRPAEAERALCQELPGIVGAGQAKAEGITGRAYSDVAILVEKVAGEEIYRILRGSAPWCCGAHLFSGGPLASRRWRQSGRGGGDSGRRRSARAQAALGASDYVKKAAWSGRKVRIT